MAGWPAAPVWLSSSRTWNAQVTDENVPVKRLSLNQPKTRDPPGTVVGGLPDRYTASSFPAGLLRTERVAALPLEMWPPAMLAAFASVLSGASVDAVAQ